MDTLAESLFDLFVVGFQKLFVYFPERIFPPFLSNGIEDCWEVVSAAKDDFVIFSYGVDLIISHFAKLDD